MSELLEAAKAVLEGMGTNESWFGDPEEISCLRAAVERAEKQRDMVFESWAISEPRISAYEWESCKLTWTIAQQAERERLWNGVIIAVERLKTIDTEGLLSDFTDRILEAADNECKEIKTAAQQAMRGRIRARARIAAEKTWKAGGCYVGPQHYLIDQFVDALLEDGDATAE